MWGKRALNSLTRVRPSVSGMRTSVIITSKLWAFMSSRASRARLTVEMSNSSPRDFFMRSRVDHSSSNTSTRGRHNTPPALLPLLTSLTGSISIPAGAVGLSFPLCPLPIGLTSASPAGTLDTPGRPGIVERNRGKESVPACGSVALIPPR